MADQADLALDAPKADAPIADAPKVDAPKGDVKADAPKVDAPKEDAPKLDKDGKPIDVKADAPKADDAPADYTTLKMPEGYKTDDPAFAEAVKLFGTEKIAPEVAQKLLDFTVERDKALGKAIADNNAAAFAKTRGPIRPKTSASPRRRWPPSTTQRPSRSSNRGGSPIIPASSPGP